MYDQCYVTYAWVAHKYSLQNAPTAPLPSDISCLLIRRPLKASCCIAITQKWNGWCKPAPVHTLFEWVVFCWAIIPQGQQEFLYCSTVENVIPQRWIVNIVFLSPNMNSNSNMLRALPCLSSNQITCIPRVYTAFCLSFWLAHAHESVQTDMSIKHSDTQNNNGRFTRYEGNSHSLDGKSMVGCSFYTIDHI